MRLLFSVVLMLGLAACSPPTRWEKPGISQETKEADLTVCRRAAAKQGLAYYPSMMNPPAALAYQAPWGLMGTYSDDFRYHADFRLTADCMRYKGYEQVPVPN